ncbi:hypothetical protein MMC28_001071 [Mycoblastus sanguinarius]|nr:hypothetical protein [Mycoblastus sanguinarius]
MESMNSLNALDDAFKNSPEYFDTDVANLIKRASSQRNKINPKHRVTKAARLRIKTERRHEQSPVRDLADAFADLGIDRLGVEEQGRTHQDETLKRTLQRSKATIQGLLDKAHAETIAQGSVVALKKEKAHVGHVVATSYIRTSNDNAAEMIVDTTTGSSRGKVQITDNLEDTIMETA